MAQHIVRAIAVEITNIETGEISTEVGSAAVIKQGVSIVVSGSFFEASFAIAQIDLQHVRGAIGPRALFLAQHIVRAITVEITNIETG